MIIKNEYLVKSFEIIDTLGKHYFNYMQHIVYTAASSLSIKRYITTHLLIARPAFNFDLIIICSIVCHKLDDTFIIL